MQKILLNLKDNLFIVLFVVLILGTVTLVFADQPPALPADTFAAPSQASNTAVTEASQQDSASSSPAAQQPQAAGMMGMVLPFALMFLVLYLFVIRPQNKKQKDHTTMLGALQHGDEIVTQSGMLGKVTGITDRVVTLEIAQNVKVKMLKDHVSKVIKGDIKDLA